MNISEGTEVAEQELRLASVYVFDDSRGHIKVGWAVNPQKRLETIEAGNPGKVTLALSREMPSPVARAVERKVHLALKPRRVGKEWFAATPLEAKAAIDEAVRDTDPGRCSVIPTDLEPVTRNVVMLRLPQSLYERVADLAKRDDRSVPNFLKVLIEKKIGQVEEAFGNSKPPSNPRDW